MHSLPLLDPVSLTRGGIHSLPLSDLVAMNRGGTIGLDLAANGPSILIDHHSRVDLMTRPGRDTLPLPADVYSKRSIA